MAALPGHAVEPVAHVLGLKCGLEDRVSCRFGRDDGLLVGPGSLLQLIGATIADASAQALEKPPESSACATRPGAPMAPIAVCTCDS